MHSRAATSQWIGGVLYDSGDTLVRPVSRAWFEVERFRAACSECGVDDLKLEHVEESCQQAATVWSPRSPA